MNSTSFNYKKIIKHQATAVITIKIYDLIFLVKKHISIMRSKGKSNKVNDFNFMRLSYITCGGYKVRWIFRVFF